ncbi:AraC family transcriptional regulator [Marinobacter daqiaonensis]|nr:helix-turn-helix domain-containing protein [Marinobacter daqiaonensis]
MDTARPENWLSALQVLTASPRLSLKTLAPAGSGSFRARLSFLPSADLMAWGTYTRRAGTLTGTNAGATAIVMPVAGEMVFEVREGQFSCGPWTPFVLDPTENFHLTLSEEAHLFIVQLPGLSGPHHRDQLRFHQDQLAELLTNFLGETPFFRDHKHAQGCLDRFSGHLHGFIKTGYSPLAQSRNRKDIRNDRRLCNAIRLLNEELDTEISIESVASRSGLSLRNFHYLMKHYIRQSPYQYIRGRRLIKAREAIIRDYPENISIAQQASNWGFQHAGRFSRYYQQHFGEYPNETLAELDRLGRFARQVRSTAGGNTAAGEYWLTSKGTPTEASLDGDAGPARQKCLF